MSKYINAIYKNVVETISKSLNAIYKNIIKKLENF